MDKDSIKGLGKQVSGSLKEAVGKATGDTEAEGVAKKSAGKAQRAVGGVQDKVRDTL